MARGEHHCVPLEHRQQANLEPLGPYLRLNSTRLSLRRDTPQRINHQPAQRIRALPSTPAPLAADLSQRRPNRLSLGTRPSAVATIRAGRPDVGTAHAPRTASLVLRDHRRRAVPLRPCRGRRSIRGGRERVAALAGGHVAGQMGPVQALMRQNHCVHLKNCTLCYWHCPAESRKRRDVLRIYPDGDVKLSRRRRTNVRRVLTRPPGRRPTSCPFPSHRSLRLRNDEPPRPR